MHNSNGSRANGRLNRGPGAFPDVSVIVVGYNSLRHLERCFSALCAQRYAGKIELIFVDNLSSDRSAAYVRDRYPDIVLLKSEANLGYAGGNNLGARHASGSVLVFLNPDTEVKPNWLATLIRPMLDDPQIGMTTSKILMMSERDVINTCGNDVSLAGITWCRGAGNPASTFDTDADVSAVSGCAFAIRRQLFEDLNGFDERFFMYLEDTDLSWRARVAGYRCRFVADSIVYHDYHLDLTAWKIGLIERNRYRMLGKHLSLRGIICLAPALVAAEILTWGYATLRGPKCVMAKARSTAWAVTQLGPVVRTRWRPVEGSILRDHALAPPVVEGLGGRPSRVAQRVIGVLSRAATELSLRLLPATGRVSTSDPETVGSVFETIEHTQQVNVPDAKSPDREQSGVGLR